MYTRNPYEVALDKNGANYAPLSPLSFIRRTAAVFPERTAVIHGAIRRSWRETFETVHSAGGSLEGARHRSGRHRLRNGT